MHSILKKLAGGDRGSIGRSNEVVTQVLAYPAYFPDLFEGLSSDDPVIRMRVADAVEKITVQRAELLQPFKRQRLAIASSSTQQEVRWHAARMLPRVTLTSKERIAAFDILYDYLRDKSSIVKTFAMQAIWDLAASDPKRKARIIPLIEQLALVGTPAMRARGRKLLRKRQRNITPSRPHP